MKKIYVFDFDKTLIDTVLPEQGKYIYKEKTGKDWEFAGWWGRPESLDMNIFDHNLIDYTYQQYLQAKSEPNTITVLLTGRLEKLRKGVQNILEKHNLTFDKYYFCDGRKVFEFKISVFEELLKDENVSELNMYDDRNEHIDGFRHWASQQKVKVNVIHV